MIGESGWHFPRLVLAIDLITGVVDNLLGVANTSEAGPADICAIRKVVNEIFSFGKLAEVAWASHATFE